MSEQSKVFVGVAVGALVGATAGYLFLTDRGRAMRDQLEPTLDNARLELTRFQGTILKAAAMAIDGLRLAQEFNRKIGPPRSEPTLPH